MFTFQATVGRSRLSVQLARLAQRNTVSIVRPSTNQHEASAMAVDDNTVGEQVGGNTSADDKGQVETIQLRPGPAAVPESGSYVEEEDIETMEDGSTFSTIVRRKIT